MVLQISYQKYSIKEDFPAKLLVQAPLLVIHKMASQTSICSPPHLTDETAFPPDMALPQNPATVPVTQIGKALLTDHWHLNEASCHSPSDPPDLAILDIITATKLLLVNTYSGLGKD
jgi:hypothetical protein